MFVESFEKYYSVHNVLPGIHHIQETRLGVCVTLIVGQESALLLDTGNGLYDLPAQVRKITDKPLTVVNTHGHHDHACGNALFPSVKINEADIKYCKQYTDAHQRRDVLKYSQLASALPESFDSEAFLQRGTGTLAPLTESSFDLGGVKANVIAAPGHTPGSVALYVEPQRVLLIGDNWNPETWILFPECEPLTKYIETMQSLIKIPFKYVLASHSSQLAPRERLERFVEGLTPETLDSAIPSANIRFPSQYECRPEPGTKFVFDMNKWKQPFCDYQSI
jgi:glyoxylase-like metal-dependent hydrolase (beta-lactamase superfamily II)